jgi:hypothetical protein
MVLAEKLGFGMIIVNNLVTKFCQLLTVGPVAGLGLAAIPQTC